MTCFLFGSGSSSTRVEMCWGWKSPPYINIYIYQPSRLLVAQTQSHVSGELMYKVGCSKDLDMFLSSFHSSSSCNDAGFLQKNNSLEEKGRMMGSFREKEQSHNRENREKETRFTRTETDFSNLFARGKPSPSLLSSSPFTHFCRYHDTQQLGYRRNKSGVDLFSVRFTQ